jgi:uncharacterized membrane protein YdbT with pleckstrin-like domain
MKYPKSSLSKDETIVFDVHHHALVLAKPAVILIVYAAVWFVLMIYVGFFRTDWALLAGIILFIVAASYIAWEILSWTHMNLVLTDRRFIYQSGVFTRHSREIPLSKINDVTMLQMVLGRLFGMGDIIIDSGSDSGQWAIFDVPRPGNLKLSMLEGAHAAQNGPAGDRELALEAARTVSREQPTLELPPLPPERPPLYSEIVDQIERLDAMREWGVISGGEFDEAKQGLLARLNREPEE